MNISLNQILTVECKKTSRGAEYRGTAHKTKSGLTCQRWDAQYPHRHPQNTPQTNPSAGLERNFCRNPDNEPAPWCYTTSSSKRFELCDVPKCPPGTRFFHEDQSVELICLFSFLWLFSRRAVDEKVSTPGSREKYLEFP